MAWRYPLCRSPKPVWRQACSTPYALPARDRPGGRLRGINGKQYPDPAESRSRVCPRGDSHAPQAGWGPAICRRRLRFCLIFPPGCVRESYDSAYTLLFSGLAVVTLLCALTIWLTLCRKGGRYPNPQQWILNPLDRRGGVTLPATAFPVCSANRDCYCFADGTMLIRAAHMRRPGSGNCDSQAAVWRVIQTGFISRSWKRC